MTEKYGFVYLWRDKKNNRYYVGSHWGTENDGYICSSKWMNDSYKRRPNDFKRRILSISTSRKELLKKEQYYLLMIKDHEIKHRYYNLNNKKIGHWTTNDKSLLTVGQKISESHKNNPNWGNWAKGKVVSEETREKLRQHNLGKTHSEETKLKCRSYSHTEEAKEKISKNNKENRVYKEENLKKFYEAGHEAIRGKKQTKEHRDKIRAKQLGQKRKPHTEETKRKIAETKKSKTYSPNKGSTGMFWVNNGTINKMTKDSIPNGFVRG